MCMKVLDYSFDSYRLETTDQKYIGKIRIDVSYTIQSVNKWF